ncbi:unnamed protein product [Parnassius mnemosyne]|uniref:Uncharacterized protein n=1 Tax=Parnassius mnemosyne TaxID=213953 RepID=A0AAV1KLH9_9NEOP
MRHNRCSKIISMVRSTSSSQESNLNTNYYELPLSTTNENNSLNDADLHISSDIILDFDSDDSVFDKNYLPSSLDPSKCSEDSDSSTNTIPQSPSINVTVPESPEVSSDEDTPQNFTKKGTIRKRKKYVESPAQRKQIKKLKDMESKYILKPGCNDGCKKKCHTQFTEEARQNLIHHFRNMSWKEQQYFIINNTSKEDHKRKTVKENRKLPRNISYDFYRKVVKKLNICFTKLGHEECEACEKFFIHNPEYKEKRHRNCQECRDYERHREKYTSAREAYKKDVEKQNNANITSDTTYFAADLEKIIMLPRIEEFKIVMFFPRVIAFNESFVPIGDKKKQCYFANLCCDMA